MKSRLRIRSDVNLGQLSADHADKMFQWLCDPTIRTNLGVYRQPSLEYTQNWITNAQKDPSIQPFTIIFNGQYVGNIVLDQINQHLASSRLSIYIGEESCRGKGVGQTAVYLALATGFEKLSLHKIWLIVHSQNIAAIRTYYSLGFSLEGILRDEFWLDDRRANALYLGILANDFHKIKSDRN